MLHVHSTLQIFSISNEESDKMLASVKKKYPLFRDKFSIKSVYGECTLEALTQDILGIDCGNQFGANDNLPQTTYAWLAEATYE
ncbi:unnamed protein product, partial [Rotaria sp. Silwood1]